MNKCACVCCSWRDRSSLSIDRGGSGGGEPTDDLSRTRYRGRRLLLWLRVKLLLLLICCLSFYLFFLFLFDYNFYFYAVFLSALVVNETGDFVGDELLTMITVPYTHATGWSNFYNPQTRTVSRGRLRRTYVKGLVQKKSEKAQKLWGCTLGIREFTLL